MLCIGGTIVGQVEPRQGTPCRWHPGRPAVVKMGTVCGSANALHTEGTLGGQLKLKWVQARMSWGIQFRECSDGAARAVFDAGWRVLVCSMQEECWWCG